ncbi:MAG: MaoC/PaaZ C-terminal domain-containing protein [Thermodesulfobacteriota bacterium]|nr:MaoC/PaaZ C-terminal domain-containing protein [Thermodesulfobacteriota bacterium]
MGKQMVYFEDVNTGDEIPSLTKDAIQKLQLVLYCGASYDHNPIHVVEDFAKAAGYPSTFAHGMLSMGFTGQLLGAWLPHNSMLKKLNVRFSAITFPGDVVTCRGKISKKYTENGQNFVELEIWVEKQDGAKTITGSALVTLPSKNT